MHVCYQYCSYWIPGSGESSITNYHILGALGSAEVIANMDALTEQSRCLTDS